jgi:hypothetical protein
MNLLLIHGIAQGGKNPKDLERAWLEALAKGLKKSKLTMPGYVNVLFPYYADQLDKFVAQFDMPTGNQVTAKGGAMDNDYAQFRAQMAEDMRKQAKIPVEQIKQEAGPAVAAEKGPQNWKWVLATLRVLDRHLPHAGSWTIETFVRDVFLYTRRQAVQNTIDKIVTDTMNNSPTVIVGHSLGSIVAYNVAVNRKPSVTTLLLTLGSPLGLPAVRSNLVPLKNPSGNKGWTNAYDPRDVVALYPLNKTHFGVSPAITNHGKVDNWTDNRHGIVGYLDDMLVAKTIHACLTA